MKLSPCGRAVVLLAALTGFLPSIHAASGDNEILAARDAFRVGNEKKLLALQESTRSHDLAAYVDYWAQRLRLDSLAAADISAFQERWPDSLVAERLRQDWVKLLGKRRQWELAAQEYAALEDPDLEATCYKLQGRLAAKDDATLDEASSLWLNETELPSSCQPVMDALVAGRQITTDDVWARVRRLLETKKLPQARAAMVYLKAEDVPDTKSLALAMESPQLFLDRQKPNFGTSPSQRQLAMIAMGRLAHSDPLLASRYFEARRDRFSGDERGYVYGQLAWQGAIHHLPQAASWFKAAEDTPLTDEQSAWKTRAALRVGDWKLVRAAIEDMPVTLASRPEWTYWLGRALQKAGKKEEGRALFQKLAGQANFYGNLADEELGRLIDVPPQTKLSPEEIAAAAHQPAIRRALALYRLDLRTEGSREWAWGLRHAGDHFLLAAAAVAQKEGLYDRAINAADKTKGEHDYSMRYLAPYRSAVSPATKGLRLDEGWVYGLMRQESRFVTNAKSTVGASGLMQVMPTTAKWIAKKLGIKKFKTEHMADMNTNVMLGTNYMKMVLESLDNHPVLASAAYNAGPGRARQWRDDRPLEGAIYVETIPFTETRDYVKKVMSNAVYYAALFEKKPQSLKARLGTIAARNGDTLKYEDLP